MFQSASMSVPVLDLPYCNLTLPPAFQKYLAALALAKVTVCVKVIVQVVCPDPVAVVLAVVPVKVPYSVPATAALPRLVVILVMSALTLANTAIRLPAVGAVREVIVVPVWLPAADKVLTRLAQLVALTVPPVDTVLKAVCPHPESVAPLPQIPFTLALLVLTKPLKSVACIRLPTEYVI